MAVLQPLLPSYIALIEFLRKDPGYQYFVFFRQKFQEDLCTLRAVVRGKFHEGEQKRPNRPKRDAFFDRSKFALTRKRRGFDGEQHRGNRLARPIAVFIFAYISCETMAAVQSRRRGCSARGSINAPVNCSLTRRLFVRSTIHRARQLAWPNNQYDLTLIPANYMRARYPAFLTRFGCR